jgi:DNA-binding SARP family transcriptional activator
LLWLADGVDVDLWEAERVAGVLCSIDPPTEPPSGLDLLRADLLPDWAEDWLVLEQESFRQQRLHALETGAGLLCRHGRFTHALDAALAAVRAEPLRESAHRRVIEVHLAEGNHAEALRQYDGYRRLLAAELGLPPSENIRGLVGPLLGRPIDRADRREPRRPHPLGPGMRRRSVVTGELYRAQEER